MTTAMAACTGLGALPYLFLDRARRRGASPDAGLSPRATALATAVACGVMLAAAFDLVHEGEPGGGGAVTLGVLAGAAFVRAAQARLARFEHVKLEAMLGGGGKGGGGGSAGRAAARKSLLLVAIMSAHALGEGSGVGVSFCGRRGWAQGVLVTLAIGLHNIPEGLATATALVARGVRPVPALWWTLATAAPQPLLALPAFLFVDAFRAALPLAMGFAAGCMVWMVAGELLPDALAAGGGGGGSLSRAASADGGGRVPAAAGGGGGPPSSPRPSPSVATPAEIATVLTVSAAGLEALRMALATLETPGGTLAPPMAAATAAAAARAAPAALLALAAAALAGAGGAAASARWLVPAAGAGALGLGTGAIGWVALTSVLACVRAGGGLRAAAAAGLGALTVWSGVVGVGGRAAVGALLFGAARPAPPPPRSDYHHLIVGDGQAPPPPPPPPADLPTHVDAGGRAVASGGTGRGPSPQSAGGAALALLALHGAVSGWASPAEALTASSALAAVARSLVAGGVVSALAGAAGAAKGGGGGGAACCAPARLPLLAAGAATAAARPLAAALAAAAGLAAPPPSPLQGAFGAPAGVSAAGLGRTPTAGRGPLAGLALPAVAGALLAVAAGVMMPTAVAATKPRLAGRAAVVGGTLAAVAWVVGA